MKRILFIAFLMVLPVQLKAQRVHLELGGALGFKDEFYLNPTFDDSSRYTEFHLYDINLFARVSKLRWGGEIGINYEKAGNYFVRKLNNSTELDYFNLNRLSINVSPFFYLVKKSHFKWDIQLGVRHYFNLNKAIYIPFKEELKVWKLADRFTTNFTFKSVILGLFYEHDIVTDYHFKPSNAVFGIRLGVIY